MRPEQVPYYEAFFGVKVQERVYNRVKEGFEEMMEAFISDLRQEFPKISTEILIAGILVGLQKMGEISDMPRNYFTFPRAATESKKAATAEIRRLLRHQADIERAKNYSLISTEEYEIMYAEQQGLRANLMAELESHIKNAIAEGTPTDEAKVQGFCEFLKKHEDPEGYAFFLIGLKLPMELGVWTKDAVIEAMNAHPAFQFMKRGRPFKGPYSNPFVEVIR